MFEVSWVWKKSSSWESRTCIFSCLRCPEYEAFYHIHANQVRFFHRSFPGVHFFTLMPTAYQYIFPFSLFPFCLFAIFPWVVVAFCCQQTIQLLGWWGRMGVYHTDFFLGSSVDIPYSKCTCTSKHATGLREHRMVQNSDKTAGVHVLPDVPPRLPPGLLCGRSIKCTCTSKHVTGHSIQ